jgi:hypothetical protein
MFHSIIGCFTRALAKACRLTFMLGVIVMSFGNKQCFCENAAPLNQSSSPVLGGEPKTSEMLDILSQSDYGVRELYMIRPEQLAAAIAKAESGELHIYRVLSSTGTVANRVVLDEFDRKFSEVFYTQKYPKQEGSINNKGELLPHEFKSPADERDFHVQQIRLYRYDERGREVWEGWYNSKKVLMRSLESIRDKTGLARFMQWRDPDGIIRYKMLCDDLGHSVGHVYFDDTGKRIIDFRGEIPKGMDASAIPPAMQPKPKPEPLSSFGEKKSLFKKIFEKNKKKVP